MNDLFFNDYGVSKKIGGNIDLSKKSTIMKAGIYNSFKISKADIGCATDIVAVKCGDCEEEAEPVHIVCLNQRVFDKKGYFGIFIKDTFDIPAFTIMVGGNEIMSFYGGTYIELEEAMDSYEIEFVANINGYVLYVDHIYSNDKVSMMPYVTDVFLLNDTICIQTRKHTNLSLSFEESGCYRLLLYKGDTQTGISNTINVVDHEPKMTLVSYIAYGVFQRKYLPFEIFGQYTEVEGDAIALSNGKTSYSNTTIRSIEEFLTNTMTNKEHIELIRILRAGVRINAQKYIMFGDYAKTIAALDGSYHSKGNLENQDLLVYESGGCIDEDCDRYSTMTINIHEKDMVDNIQLQEI